MKPMERRVSTLERAGPVQLSPALQAWLGWSLSAAEQHALDAGGDEREAADIDTRTWSKELRTWLGVE
jgi:hypothetical protein